MENLHIQKLIKTPANPSSTQTFLDIDKIKDGIAILNNGSLRAVLMVSSINFDLKSSEEQDAIIGNFQGFLNPLDFPVQIFITSRKINLKYYVQDLQVRSREQTNELLHLQMEEYIKYITDLTAKTNIVNKYFYIVVPFSPTENQKSGLVDKFFEIFSPKNHLKEDRASFEIYKDQLWQRVEHIQYGLNGAGIRMVPLNTQELIELYYSLYNPAPVEKLDLAPVEEMAVNTSLYA
ncbi:MAG: hypothetical protein ABIC19_03900 [Patescibacteria group bacterium]